ncbi:MAG: beta-galactosidase BgaS [Thermoproteota archaeon]
MKFPEYFKFGFSTVGVQHELGTSGSEFDSDWILWLKDPENIAAGIVSGDDPFNGPGYWQYYRTDHSIARSIGMNTAWITVEWARIFPKPTVELGVQVEERDDRITSVVVDEKHIEMLENLANKDALNHYREIMLDWKQRGGFLIVNLFHWSIPTWLHDPVKVRRLGPDRAPAGWLDKRTVVEFAKFAAYVARELDPLVDAWYTMNEPTVVSRLGYLYTGSGFPPGYLSKEACETVNMRLSEAHARAYECIKMYSSKPVGIVESASPVHVKNGESGLAERLLDENLAVVEAVYSGRIRNEVRDDLKNKLDWLGLNYYTRTVVSNRGVEPGYGYLCTPRGVSRDGRPCSDVGWEIYPEGLFEIGMYLHRRYGLTMYITENGLADAEDRFRPGFVTSHLAQVLRLIENGVDVRGYFHWNLTDNLEWSRGFEPRFGLVEIDYSTKKRRLRPSALVFKEISTSRELPEEIVPG